jgi:rubrerythrin
MRCPIATVEEFYAHAIAIEREAAERYTEFEAYFTDHGQDVLAGLCHNLAVLERSHLAALIQASQGLTLPAIPAGGYRWLEAGSPEAAARELFYRVASERQLMEIALHAEKKAQRFFEWIAANAPDEAVRALAREMAREEEEHVRWVRSAIDYAPAKPIDWVKVLARASGPGPGAFLGVSDPLPRPKPRKAPRH